MKEHLFSNPLVVLALIAICTCLFMDHYPLSPPIVQAEWGKLVSITGGSPAKRLSSAMVAAGYTGPSSLDELTLCNLDANSNTVYLGGTSAVNASDGYPLAPGDCLTYRSAGRAIDSSTLFLFVSASESIAVTLRPR